MDAISCYNCWQEAIRINRLHNRYFIESNTILTYAVDREICSKKGYFMPQRNKKLSLLFLLLDPKIEQQSDKKYKRISKGILNILLATFFSENKKCYSFLHTFIIL